MLTVIYDPLEGQCVPDGKAIAFAERHCQRAKANAFHQVPIGNETMLTAFRLLVKRGLFPHDRIRIQFGDVLLPVSETGKLSHWPQGLAACHRAMIVELLS